jgi:hypothetical protein
MKSIKKLNDKIQYAELYRKFKAYSNKRRAFNLGGLATGGLEMEDNPDDYTFAQEFYSNQPQIEQMAQKDNFLNKTLEETRAKLKARTYADNRNATNMDSLSEIFNVFNENAENVSLSDAPNVSLSDVEGATQFVNTSGETVNYEVDGSNTKIPKAMIAMRKEGMGKYDTLFNNQNNIKKSKYYGKDVTKMTLGEVAEFAEKGGEYNKHNNKTYGANTTATGYYQMLGGTIEDILNRGGKQLGLTKQSLYNKENQDKMYIWYMSDSISRKTTLDGMKQSVMARWEAFRNNDLTEKRKDSKGETYNYYFPKDDDVLTGVILEHLRAFHPNHKILKSLGSKRGN